MTETRTKNSVKNASIATISKIIFTVMSFVCRTIFIKILGTEYLGVNGLFTNILTMLSFAELGIGTAIIFKMYKPIAEDDQERIKTLMHFYKRAYAIIGTVILIVGLMVIPFLSNIVKGTPNIKENLSVIYVLFLLNTCISYFFAYKKSIIAGHQKEYIINLIYLIVIIVQDVLQIIFLYITHNYIIYLLLQILATLIDNLIVSKISDKMYPYIKDKKYIKITKNEQLNIFNDVKSIIFYQIANVLTNGTDNIIISIFLGIGQVGLLSNYTIITSTMVSLLSSLFNSITASIGNLNTIKEKERKESVFYQVLLILFMVYGFVSIAIILLLNRFITIWLGEEYLLSFAICIVLGLNFYIDGMRYAIYTYRNTLGLFKKGRFVPLLTIIVNIILSIVLVRFWGIFGVLIATTISRLLILTCIEPYYIHKQAFGTSCIKYYKTYAYYLVILIITFVITGFVVSKIPLEGVLGFIIDGLVITAITAMIFIIATYKTKQFKQTEERLQPLINKIRYIIHI